MVDADHEAIVKVANYTICQCAERCNEWNDQGLCTGFAYQTKKDGKERSTLFPPVPLSPFPCSFFLKISGKRTRHGIDINYHLLCVKGKTTLGVLILVPNGLI